MALAPSFNEGFYSDRFNSLVGSATWTIDSANSLTSLAGGNIGRSTTATLATPLPQSNSEIFNLIYTGTRRHGR